MPPEQVYDYRYLTPTADVYSLGAVLYEMLSGHYARGTAEQWEEARTASDALEIVLEQEIMPIEQRVAGLSEPLVAALARALADDPARRYPNAGAFQSALERVTA